MLSATKLKHKTFKKMKNLKINENGTVRFNNEKLDYETLCENFTKVSTIKAGGLEVDIFKTKGGYLEYLADGSFASGEDVNFTSLSLPEIRDYYYNN